MRLSRACHSHGRCRLGRETLSLHGAVDETGTAHAAQRLTGMRPPPNQFAQESLHYRGQLRGAGVAVAPFPAKEKAAAGVVAAAETIRAKGKRRAPKLAIGNGTSSGLYWVCG